MSARIAAQPEFDATTSTPGPAFTLAGLAGTLATHGCAALGMFLVDQHLLSSGQADTLSQQLLIGLGNAAILAAPFALAVRQQLRADLRYMAARAMGQGVTPAQVEAHTSLHLRMRDLFLPSTTQQFAKLDARLTALESRG